MDWSTYYPDFVVSVDDGLEKDQSTAMGVQRTRSLVKAVTVADIGCGFGGLLVALAPKLADELMVGMGCFNI